MPSITVRDIPDELYEKLKAAAAANRRSINSEIIVAIEETVGRRRIDVDEFLENVRQLRQLTAHIPITDDELNEMKRAGRE